MVGAKKAGESQITGHAVFKANRREQDYGRTIESVSPYNLYYASTVKNLSLYGYFAQEYNPVTAVIFREKNEPSTEREYSKSELALKATTGVRGKITMDVSRVEMLETPGEYEVAYKSKDNTISEFVGFNVVEDQGFSQDNYGILAITQKPNREFVIETFKSEDEMQAKKTAGTTLISIRGLLGMTEGGIYTAKSDSTINKAIEYRAPADNSILVQRVKGGIKIGAGREGKLLWNGITIADKFDIFLEDGLVYSNKRSEDKNTNYVELRCDYNNIDFNALLFKAEVNKYKIYEEEFSMSGGLLLGPVLPSFIGDANARIDLHELLLQEQARMRIPPIHAEGSLAFKPGDLFGDFVGGGAGLEMELNTLPGVSPHYLRAYGELDISDVIYLEGELVFAWYQQKGNTYFMPDALKFFGRIGEGGVPLVPPVVLAYINGIGGGISGIAETVMDAGSGKIPPIAITVSGAVADVTGLIASIEKATITIGAQEFSIIANEATLLKIINFYDVGLATGIKEGKGGYPKAYINAGGRISIRDNTIYEDGIRDMAAQTFWQKFIHTI